MFPIFHVYLVISVLNLYFMCPKWMLTRITIVSHYKYIPIKSVIHNVGIRKSMLDLIHVSLLPGRLTELLGTCFPGHKSHGKRADHGINWDLFPLAESQDSGIQELREQEADGSSEEPEDSDLERGEHHSPSCLGRSPSRLDSLL
ncbi:uncharacterized protein ACIB01_019538 isoform 2-T2 [Guaruba guarouba]